MTHCPREEDVLDTVAARRWPERCDAGLAAHLRDCAACADLAAVAAALLEDHESAWQEARVPSPALVWWRAQARAREEAARAAARPIAFAQGAAATCAVWGAVWLLRAFGPVPLDWRGWLTRTAETLPDVSGLTASVPGGLPLLAAAAGSLLVLPLLLFVVVRAVLGEE